jgi:hypothetical protein
VGSEPVQREKNRLALWSAQLRRIILNHAAAIPAAIVGYAITITMLKKTPQHPIFDLAGMVFILCFMTLCGIPMMRLFEQIGPPTWETAETLKARSERGDRIHIVIRIAFGLIVGCFFGRDA